jgi:hypothetical protein
MLSRLFSPDALGWDYNKLDQWVHVQQNWKEFYQPEKREDLAKLIVADFKHHFKTSAPEPEDFGNYAADLQSFKVNFLKVLEEYKFKTFCKGRFFTFNRKLLMTEGMPDQQLASILRDYVPSRFKVSKEDLKLMLETYLFCFEYVAQNLNKKEVQVKQLELLGLPTEVTELRELVVTCESLGELFSWKATGFPFDYWVTSFLKDSEVFKRKVYDYLNTLHPELRLPIQEKAKKSSVLTLDFDEAVNNYANLTVQDVGRVGIRLREPTF